MHEELERRAKWKFGLKISVAHIDYWKTFAWISSRRRGNRGDLAARTILEFSLATSEDQFAAHDIGGFLDRDSVGGRGSRGAGPACDA